MLRRSFLKSLLALAAAPAALLTALASKPQRVVMKPQPKPVILEAVPDKAWSNSIPLNGISNGKFYTIGPGPGRDFPTVAAWYASAENPR